VSTFTTEVQIGGKSLDIKRTDQFVTIGSCFADHIGQFLRDHKFDVISNPLGILYNPISLCRICDQILKTDTVQSDSWIVQHDGLWHSLMHHGQFSHVNKEALKERLDTVSKKAAPYLRDVNFLFITLGSAHAYRYHDTGDIVANCHKLPSTKFEKVLVSSEQIISNLEKRIQALKALNKNLQVIWTVSPVRYIRDGLIENNRSKANLLMATHYLADTYDFCHYFPAYELVIDELRDYRYYKPDMVHPNHQAIDFVLDKFVNFHFSQCAQEQVHLIGKLRRSLLHRPLHPASETYKIFRKKLMEDINQLAQRYSNLDFEEELLHLQREF